MPLGLRLGTCIACLRSQSTNCWVGLSSLMVDGRVGGIFDLAKLADRLMDSWMSNPTLNGNAKVSQWTQSGQRQGFKFLVTQVRGRPHHSEAICTATAYAHRASLRRLPLADAPQVCGYLTGGPQRYTGQPMDVAHKHLGISPDQ